jgi:hypothetical protein
MPVGELFLYAIWVVIAIGSTIAAAAILRGGHRCRRGRNAHDLRRSS